MDKIAFFDIDKTLFDRTRFLDNFFEILSKDFNLTQIEVNNISDFYEEIKKEYGYFSYNALLIRIYEKLPNLNKKLDYYFEQDNLDLFLYEDCKILFEIKDCRLGIFSKGDMQFQKAKIKKFENITTDDLIYIYHDKLQKLNELITKYIDSKLFFIDDNLTVLINAKDINPNVVTILIDRKNEFEKVNGIDFKLTSLSDIMPILN